MTFSAFRSLWMRPLACLGSSWLILAGHHLLLAEPSFQPSLSMFLGSLRCPLARPAKLHHFQSVQSLSHLCSLKANSQTLKGSFHSACLCGNLSPHTASTAPLRVHRCGLTVHPPSAQKDLCLQEWHDGMDDKWLIDKNCFKIPITVTIGF